MRKIVFILLSLVLLFPTMSCDSTPKAGDYVVVADVDDTACEVEGHSQDHHADKYDYTAGTQMVYDVYNGKLIQYRTPTVPNGHSFEIWRCASCGQYFKIYRHTYVDGICTVCGCIEK